jgi:Na+-transporting methylmalonyl-CoA/oxaloacetate decarboxylase gamma subunit
LTLFLSSLETRHFVLSLLSFIFILIFVISIIMQFRVVIPDHVKAGQTIRVHCPDGTEANVKVPKGMKTGDSFIFEMSVDQLNNPEALLETIKKRDAEKGFLDREIVNAQDFLLALCVGLIIGMGIVFGFLIGILWATQGVAAAMDPQQQHLLATQQQQQQRMPGNQRVMTHEVPGLKTK